MRQRYERTTLSRPSRENGVTLAIVRIKTKESPSVARLMGRPFIEACSALGCVRRPSSCSRSSPAIRAAFRYFGNERVLMELRQAPIAKRQSRQPFDRCVAIYLKLLVRKGVAGQSVHREQRAES